MCRGLGDRVGDREHHAANQLNSNAAVGAAVRGPGLAASRSPVAFVLTVFKSTTVDFAGFLILNGGTLNTPSRSTRSGLFGQAGTFDTGTVHGDSNE